MREAEERVKRDLYDTRRRGLQGGREGEGSEFLGPLPGQEVLNFNKLLLIVITFFFFTCNLDFTCNFTPVILLL